MHAMTLERYELVVRAEFGIAVDAHHQGNRWAVDIRVEQAHARPFPGHGDREVHGNGRFPYTALARGDCESAPNPGDQAGIERAGRGDGRLSGGGRGTGSGHLERGVADRGRLRHAGADLDVRNSGQCLQGVPDVLLERRQGRGVARADIECHADSAAVHEQLADDTGRDDIAVESGKGDALQCF